MNKESNINIVWDYDGTLVDSRTKNFNVTRKIIEKSTGYSADTFPALKNLRVFEFAHQRSLNWRDFYKNEIGFSEDQISNVGELWTEFQLSDETPVALFPGIKHVIDLLSKYTQSIVSQNSKENIIKFVKNQEIDSLISCVIGFEEVPIHRQKPYPDGLLRCLEELNITEPAIVFYIGDHETDVELTLNTAHQLKSSQIKFISIGAFYIFKTDTSNWKYRPDFEAKKVDQILDIIYQHK
jgi:phosphoglycolate phosphatase-like HAD superfamily hydrolase